MSRPVWIVGASARAAAFSALRAGFEPRCADLFADLDLAAVAPVDQVHPRDFPDALRALERHAPAAPFLYTGGLENEPGLIDALASRRPLWGIAGCSLRRARDPRILAEVARGVGLPAPALAFDADGLPRNGSWLVKPRASSGGAGIRFLVADTTHGASDYFQKRVAGLDVSALFLGDGSNTRMIAVTRQILGRPGALFAYVGSVGPWPVPETTRGSIERLGGTLANSLNLRGLFGIDLILRDDVPWLIEVNPRYTASVEVIEHAAGLRLAAEHARVFGVEANIEPRPPRMRPRFVGKQVIFARRALLATDLSSYVTSGLDALPEIADIPPAGLAIAPGDPVLTVYSEGRTIEECETKLARAATAWDDRIHGTT